MAGEWSIEIGDRTTRRQVAEVYGGALFGGIQPSRKTSNVLIYSDPLQGKLHGYNYDGWDPDRRSPVYYYTGEGQVGHQDPEAKGNGAILRHLEDHRALRLFEATGPNRGGGKPQRYVGEFRVDPVDPWQFREAPDREGDLRNVVVFRFIALEPEQSRAVSEAGVVAPLGPNVEFDERRLRQVAMRWLEQRTDGGRQALTVEDLKDFDGGYSLIDLAAHLWQPPGFSAVLSIRETSEVKHARVTAHGLVLTSPSVSVAPSLDTARDQKLPLVWFQGIGAGRYLPIFPLYVVGEEEGSYVLSPDETFGRVPEVPESALEVAIRRYAIAETKRRLHQPMFRANILRAYGRRCAICALAHVELLDAAHIVPDSEELGIPVVQNGLALCKLHHSAYDSHILGITPDLTVEIATRVLEEVDGPTLKYGLQERHGERLMALPTLRHEWPDIALISRQYELFRVGRASS